MKFEPDERHEALCAALEDEREDKRKELEQTEEDEE